MTENKIKRNFAGLHTLVALMILFIASIHDSISPFTYAASFFFYLAIFHFLTKKEKLKPVLGNLFLGIILYLLGYWM